MSWIWVFLLIALGIVVAALGADYMGWVHLPVRWRP